MEKVRLDFRDQIAGNKRSSFFLLAFIFIIFIGLGFAIASAFGEGYFFIIMIIAIIFTLTYILIGYYKSDKIAVASVGAKQVKKEGRYKQYYDLVEGLTIASGLPMPRLYVMPSQQINAFASGRDPKNAVVCVTEGALDKLDKRELEGVLAHELSHIANFDIRYMTIATVLVGMIAIISEIFLRSLFFSHRGSNKGGGGIFLVIAIVVAILAPITVKLVQLAISRKREYSADATAVQFTRYPNGLIGALSKIKNSSGMDKKEASKAMAPLFFANPFKGWTSTHPPIEQRIRALERM